MSDNINDSIGIQIPLPLFNPMREMSAVEYFNTKERLYKWIIENCGETLCKDCIRTDCPFDRQQPPLFTLEARNPKEAIAIVQKWAKEHPEKKHKTYSEDFLEKFPKAWRRDGIPYICRNEVYKGKNCPLGMRARFSSDCTNCWNEEMEN